jgi:hypothetical protein
MADLAESSVALVVGGRVRRGRWVALDSPIACERCARPTDLSLVSPKGRTTFVCEDCAIACGEPAPVAFGGRTWRTVAEVRTAAALGQPHPPFDVVERYERDAARFERATRRHGFHRTDANPNRRLHLSLWHPFWTPEQGGTGRAGGNG